MADGRQETGILATLALLIGGGCLLVALLSAINVAFALELKLQVYGTDTALPRDWDGVVGLAAVGVLIAGLTLFGGLVRRKFAAAKGRPLVRAGILAGAALLLAAAFRGLQILALTHTYGSMLAYYATDGDLDDVRAELAKGPDRAALDQAVGRAAQYDNHESLALLLAAGADMRDSTRAPSHRRCALVGRSLAFVRTALAHGVTPDACPNGETAVWEAVQRGTSDAEAAEIVALLVAAGWSATATPSHDRRTAAEIAAAKQWTRTSAALASP
ncbi:hypothetical protein SAMN02745121_05791 [Nannocystis exedens]|uniref:Ankyrin repeat-containing protein n=1 Tax=Nannocystis exedens TaxID=54 RepID=A0A1I2DXQ6_9BACT|nr:hypothetical protein [Nannocystis exedens]PCC69144.1 Ankyrin repeats (3 copies) [Nannocystis exedens]SFE85444.1 hypothetical protein SAMN02745121_05791 [Nannocystis exedens]